MAAASLDVNFKEELSAIEQCESLILIISILPPSRSHDLISPQGSRFSPKRSAQPLFTVFYNILLKFRSASSSLFCNKWPGPTP